MSDLNTGRGAGSDEMKVFVPFKLVPELGAEYIRRFRDVEIQYKILQYILPVYEQAKVEEHRQTPSVVVLDRAGPAERKSKPKVTMYTLLAFVVSTLLAFGGALAAEMYRNLKDAHPERVRNWEEAIRRDWLGLRLRRRP
jgi:capsule polysaccharide export protein KpsE/RkpR